ncbi:MAG: LTA synthase family protein [Oscillospiraceae bacterium]|nr:LTA synthase family protein [Oscillospiraceae bacterium]
MEKTLEKRTGAKEILTQLAPCWIILFVFCYMLFIYEPLMMYCTNKNDFWFDFGIMAAPTAGIFLIFFLGAAAVFTGLFFVSRIFSKNARLCGVISAVIFPLFIALYIQGNFLIQNLPALDGSEIDWGAYTTDNIITLVICLVLSTAWIFAIVKLGLAKAAKCAAWASLAVFVMLNVSLVTTSAQNGLFERKNSFVSTSDGINGASSDKNFFIFMVDSQSASEFTQVISGQEQFRHAFDDFTYYPDALSAYAYTRDSVPFVLSGRLNKNEESFGDYCKHALNNSALFKSLDERDYDLYLYDSELAWYGKKDFNIKNAPDFNGELRFGDFFTQEMRYVWFKYLPYIFKSASDIEHLDFGQTANMFDWGNDFLYDDITGTKLQKTSGAQFRFIHAEGAHVPFDMDENMNRIEGGTYLQKTSATAKLIAAFIKRLKDSGVYDNSAIVIMSDHGYQPARNQPDNYILSRFNPILLIKGAGEKHDLVYSDKPVSYLDLPGAYNDLLGGKQSAELFPEAEYPRTRTVIWYEIYKEEHMVEYQTDGKATEWDKFRETGAVFDL